MPAANKLIYDVRENLRQYTDDSEISDRYILYLYGIKRAKYYRQELNNYQRTTDVSATQTFCLELEEVPANECGLNLQCDTILRTVKPIPQPLELHTKSAITSVKPTTILGIPFNFITKEKAVFYKNSPFKGIFAFLDNNRYIYVISDINTIKLLECITITGVFQDPLDLITYSNCCGCNDSPCINLDTINYPIRYDLVDLIKKEIVSDLINQLKIPEDKQNDSDDV